MPAKFSRIAVVEQSVRLNQTQRPPGNERSQPLLEKQICRLLVRQLRPLFGSGIINGCRRGSELRLERRISNYDIKFLRPIMLSAVGECPWIKEVAFAQIATAQPVEFSSCSK